MTGVEKLDDAFPFDDVPAHHRWTLSSERDPIDLVWGRDGFVYYRVPHAMTRAPEHEILDGLYVSATPQQTEICRHLSRELPEPTSTYWHQRWTFWRDLDPSRVRRTQLTFTTEEDPPRTYQLRVSKAGCQLWMRGRGRAYTLHDRTTLSTMFFEGIDLPRVPHAIRSQLRELLFGALSSSTTLRLEQGFPLLDYDAIPPASWSWRPEAPQDDSFVELRIERGQLWVEGWIGHYTHGGFGMRHALERLLSRQRRSWITHVPDHMLDDARAYVLGAYVPSPRGS